MSSYARTCMDIERMARETMSLRRQLDESSFSKSLIKTIRANVNNKRLTDKEFRDFVRRSLPASEH